MRYVETSLRGRGLVEGRAEGEALVCRHPISFLGGVDPETGIILEGEPELKGSNVKGKILVFPCGKGSTVGSYTLFAMGKKGTKPAGIINVKTEPIIAAGCVLAEIPLMDMLEANPIEVISTGDFVMMDAGRGVVFVRHPSFEKGELTKASACQSRT
jgi:predicted aconitase with swiveling domain